MTFKNAQNCLRTCKKVNRKRSKLVKKFHTVCLFDCSYAEEEGFEIGPPLEDTLESMSNLVEQRRMVSTGSLFFGTMEPELIVTCMNWISGQYYSL